MQASTKVVRLINIQLGDKTFKIWLYKWLEFKELSTIIPQTFHPADFPPK